MPSVQPGRISQTIQGRDASRSTAPPRTAGSVVSVSIFRSVGRRPLERMYESRVMSGTVRSPVATRKPGCNEVEVSVGEMNSVAVPSRSPTADSSTVQRSLLRATRRRSTAATSAVGSKATTGMSRTAGRMNANGPTLAPTSNATVGWRTSASPSSSASVSGSYPASPPWWSIFATYSRDGASMTSDVGVGRMPSRSCAGRGRWSSNRRGGPRLTHARAGRAGPNRARIRRRTAIGTTAR